MSELSGNIGGDFGIYLAAVGDDTQRLSVKRGGTRYSLLIGTNSMFEVVLWFAAGSEFTAQGYLWISDDGALPQLTRAEENDELVTALVSPLIGHALQDI